MENTAEFKPTNTEEKRKVGRKNDFIPFYFSDFVKGILKYWWLVLILTVLFGGVRFIISYKRYVPMYSSSATFTISTYTGPDRTDGGMTSYSFYYDNAMATQLSTAFPYILASNILQDSICEELGLTYLPASLSASSVPGSNMFTITCSGKDPLQVYDVILCAIEKCPETARYVVGKIKFMMITSPQVPTSPTNKNAYLRDSARAAVIGAFIGFIWILIYCVSRKTIRTKEEISEQLGINPVGILPQVTFKRYKQKIDHRILWFNEHIGKGFLESLRLLRNTALHELREDEKTILITSTAPGEGKTTVALNLAYSLTDLGKKILLIDWDIRNPSVLATLGINPEKTDKGEPEKEFELKKPKNVPFHILVFPSKLNYWKRMRAEYVKSVLDRLKSEYDYILIDTPPCGLISDTSVIAQSTDVALYVVLQDAVRVTRIKTGIENLAKSDIRILGCIFNGAESGLTGYGENYGYSRYNYYGKYGYGYGYAYGESATRSGEYRSATRSRQSPQRK